MDSFSEVEHVGWGRRIGESIKGIIFGVVLFIASFPVLWMNEGCAVKDYEAWAFMRANLVVVSSESVEGANEGKLVHTSGMATTDDVVRDAQFDVAVTAIRLQRNVEMYQWKEKVTERKEKKVGGGETRAKEYNYSQDWSESHIDSNDFKHKEGHENPSSMPFTSSTFNASNVALGDFALSGKLISEIGNFEGIQLDTVPEVGNRPIHKHGSGLYIGDDPSASQVGDLRVTFKKAPAQNVTVTAKQSGKTFASFPLPNEHTAERLDSGLMTPDEVHGAAKSETAIRTWLLRLGGLLAMFFGITLAVRPLSVVADVLPIVGSIVGGITGFVGFFIALTLSATTIAIAWIAYRPILAAALFAVAAIGIIMAFQMRRKPADA
ncbi:MAG: hypothetical protein ACI8W8_001540 [Rhodothermales bacterium]|jgi:hypothetical protein